MGTPRYEYWGEDLARAILLALRGTGRGVLRNARRYLRDGEEY